MRNVTRKFVYYNLDAIISIGYRVNSIVGVRFRQWATRVIKERMLAGAVQDAHLSAIDKRLLSHEKDIADLKEKVNFFVETQTPPLQKDRNHLFVQTTIVIVNQSFIFV